MYNCCNISLNSFYYGTFLCTFMIKSRRILLWLGYFYVHLWKYLAEFFLKWDIYIYFHDNISVNSFDYGTFICIFMIISRWILLRMVHFYAHSWKYLAKFFWEWDISVYNCCNMSLISSQVGTFLGTFVIISCWILLRMVHFYLHLWQYLAEFFLE